MSELAFFLIFLCSPIFMKPQYEIISNLRTPVVLVAVHGVRKEKRNLRPINLSILFLFLKTRDKG